MSEGVGGKRGVADHYCAASHRNTKKKKEPENRLLVAVGLFRQTESKEKGFSGTR